MATFTPHKVIFTPFFLAAPASFSNSCSPAVSRPGTDEKSRTAPSSKLPNCSRSSWRVCARWAPSILYPSAIVVIRPPVSLHVFLALQPQPVRALDTLPRAVRRALPPTAFSGSSATKDRRRRSLPTPEPPSRILPSRYQVRQLSGARRGDREVARSR